MNFTLTEEQSMLRDSIARFVAQHATVARHRALRTEHPGFDREVWRSFAELGWLALPFARQWGGFGGGAVDLMVAGEALGRGFGREPWLTTVVTCGGLLQRGGTGEQQARYIPPIIDGREQWAFACAERGSDFDLLRVVTRARRSGPGFALSGTKIAVLNGHCADHLIVTARTDAGVSLFVVDAAAPGLTCTPFTAVDGSRGASVTLSDVRVSAAALLGADGGAPAVLEEAIELAIVALGAEALGAMQWLLDATVEYTRTREQFGQPLGRFQALQHRMADMYLKVEETRSLLLHAAIRVDAAAPERHAACAALKVKVAEAGRFVSQQAVQLHGGIGMTDELGVGHHFKRLLLLSRLYGDEAHSLRRYAALRAEHAA